MVCMPMLVMAPVISLTTAATIKFIKALVTRQVLVLLLISIMALNMILIGTYRYTQALP